MSVKKTIWTMIQRSVEALAATIQGQEKDDEDSDTDTGRGKRIKPAFLR